MNTPFKKRANPLAQTVTQTAQQAVPVQETPVQAQPVYTPQPEIQQPVQPLKQMVRFVRLRDFTARIQKWGLK